MFRARLLVLYVIEVRLMFPIVEAEFLAPDVKRFVIEAPRIARKRKAGQFVILRVHAHGERIPLTIADSDPETGTITIIVQGIGKTTKLLNMLEAGRRVLDLVGPLGKPSDVRALRHGRGDRRRRGRGHRLSDRQGHEGGRQPRDLDPGRRGTRSW